ncbi:MAG TPA: SRPBCC family protein [Bauldia sp.]|nr:SRPBCC family protein [Bauldia sp.]
MSERNVTHSTFVLQRSYPQLPARVFRAFSDPVLKAKWFGGNGDNWMEVAKSMDFRIGGREISNGKFRNGPKIEFEATYWDIVPDERIVYSYWMVMDGKSISVSLATIELKPENGGTRLKLTEQGAYLDGFDDPSVREKGTNDLLDALGRSLAA